MFDFGLEQKGNNVIVSILHMPTNTLVKQSSQSEGKALAHCICEIQSKIKSINWLTTKDNGENIEQISFNGLISFKTKNLSSIKFGEWLDKTSTIFFSQHRFTYQNDMYTSYTSAENIDTRRILESLFKIDNAEIEISV